MRPIKTITASTAVAFSTIALTAGLAFPQDLPTAKELAGEMGFAWNIGNTMEAIGGPTSWGNPVPTQQLIDSVKAAGFKTIRIPCAWDGNANQTTYEINPTWITQVKQVVDYCIKDSLFVILNIHWDGGWLENRVDSCVTNTEMRQKIQAKQGAYWRQIATTFRNYDRHLLFASANEPNVESAAGAEVLKSFHKTFIDTVRATGGNNTSRTLVLQGPSTSSEKTIQWMTTLPSDKIANRLMMEVHFYPYQFCLMSKDETWGKVFYYWGKNNHSTTDTDRNSTWGEESYVDSVFNSMKINFVDKNIPVLLGEFGAMKRLTLTGDSLKRHIQSRRSFYEYVLSSSKKHGIIPAAWDAGGKGDGTMTVFDRKSGAIYDLGLLNAIRSGWGMSKLPGDTSLVQIATGNNSMKVLYSAKDSLFGQVNLGVVKSNMTNYDSIIVRAYINGETKYDSAGTDKYGYLSMSVVTMSDNWKWREASFGEITMNDWANYTFTIGTDTTNKNELVPADPAKIDFFALQAYSKAYRGTIYIDWIVFKSKNGASDTVYSFDQTVPEEGSGNVDAVKLISTSDIASDQEWKTATTSKWGTPVLTSRNSITRKAIHMIMSNGFIRATWFTKTSGTVKVDMKDLQGKTVFSRSLNANAGMNTLTIPVNYSGVMVLRIQQGDNKYTGKVICH